MYIGIGTLVVIVIIVLIVLFLRRLPLRRRMHSLYNPAFARDRDSVGPRAFRRVHPRDKVLRWRFGRKISYELDGGARRELRIRVCPSTITICVPVKATAGSAVAVGGEQA